MFARWSRLPLRRCLHTRTSYVSRESHYRKLALVVGLSATYITWHLSSNTNRIALDSAHAGKLSKPTKTPEPNPQLEDQQPNIAITQSTEGQDTEEKDPTTEGEDDATSSGGGGAFDPKTGEINWDCPCLGGMAHGPCGLQFREAFSCFVFSEAEPKGMDCVEKFKAMQDCFREHPDVYADEIMDDDEPENASTAGEQSPTATDDAQNPIGEASTVSPPTTKPLPDDTPPDTPASTASS